MIIACPSCATHHSLPDDDFASDGSIIKCASCGHSWLEARAVEVIGTSDIVDIIDADVRTDHSQFDSPANLPSIPMAPDTEYEAARIASAVREAEEKRLAAARKRRARIRGWLTLAACITAPVALAASFPEPVVRALPGSIMIYDKVGIPVNIPGFKFANISHQYLLAGGTRVLAIRGEIINMTSKAKTVPSLRFALRNKKGREVYHWSLNGVSRRPLKPGASARFLTRIAEPPKYADDFQIRFALSGEIAKTASYENNTDKRSQN